jgi:hypothetical protein
MRVEKQTVTMTTSAAVHSADAAACRAILHSPPLIRRLLSTAQRTEPALQRESTLRTHGIRRYYLFMPDFRAGTGSGCGIAP